MCKSQKVRSVESMAAMIAKQLAARVECVVADAPETDGVVTVFDSKKPTAISVQAYLQRWAQHSRCSLDVMVLAAVYLDRVCEGGLTLTHRNVHRALLASLVVATKWHSDSVYTNSHYATVGGVSTKEVSRLECHLLKTIDFNAHIEPETFSLYVRKLRSAK